MKLITVGNVLAALDVVRDQAYDAKDGAAVMEVTTVMNYLRHSGHYDDNDTIVEIN
jgi:hypothetical protein